MRVSHEVPLSLLEASRSWNDYDYCLVHLLDKYPQYKQFYKDSIKMGREVLIDNSIFELGEAVSDDILLQGVRDINPTYIVAPDVLGNYKATLKRTLHFKKILLDLEGRSPEVIGVLQGKTYDEYKECYKEYQKNGIGYIAIPYDINCFFCLNQERKFFTKALLHGYSRKVLLNELLYDGVINRKTKHHLLGCGDPYEFILYRYEDTFDFITSVDTSCPIILGIFGERLEAGGLGKEKRSEKLAENLEWQGSASENRLIEENVQVFRKHYLGGS